MRRPGFVVGFVFSFPETEYFGEQRGASVGESVLEWIKGLIKNHKLTSSCKGVKNGSGRRWEGRNRKHEVE